MRPPWVLECQERWWLWNAGFEKRGSLPFPICFPGFIIGGRAQLCNTPTDSGTLV